MLLRLTTYLGAIVALVGGIYYQLVLKELLSLGGHWRPLATIVGINNAKCSMISELQACEKMVLHRGTNSIFFACSTPTSRQFWEPTTNRLDATHRSLDDYVAIYNLTTGVISRLKTQGFPPKQLAVHGFDVVSSEADPSDLLFYLVNHRPPQGNHKHTGADSVIEMFKMRIASDVLEYVKTFYDPTIIITPNDVYGHGDGSFYFTNDHCSRGGIMRTLDFYFRRRSSSVGYCHVETGCKLAAQGFNGANGIARGLDDLYFVASQNVAELYVLERQADNTLLLTDIIDTNVDMPMDNISADESGNLFIAAFPNKNHFVSKTLSNPIIKSPSAVLRLSRNSGPGQYYGEKFTVKKVFQDDGSTASGITTAIWLEMDKTLFLSGVNSLHVTTCKIEDLFAKDVDDQ